jgi:hypothetical protein
MVETDGVSTSILSAQGLRWQMVKKPKLPPPKPSIDNYLIYQYLQQSWWRSSNMSDLLYCVDDPGVDKTIYRYTQDTSQGHVRETSTTFGRKSAGVVDGRSVNEWELN